MSVTYKYAINSADTILDICALTPKTRTKGAPFSCLGCGEELVPYLTANRAKHFQHKPGCECQIETYLHKLAKYVFAMAYNRAVTEGRLVALRYNVVHECAALQNIKKKPCRKVLEKTMDLTSIFNIASLEKKVSDFRADILLHSDLNERSCMVEIHVSNECSERKKHCGIPIIEITIDKEEDIEHLKALDISVKNKHLNISMYGFKTKTIRNDFCRGNCKELGYFVAIYKNGTFDAGENKLIELDQAIEAGQVLFWKRLKDGVNNDVVSELLYSCLQPWCWHSVLPRTV